MLRITARQLEAFSAIARYGNLTDASAALGLTKGALSQSLKLLEQHLGTLLFERIHPYLKLNSEGQAIRAQVDDLLSQLQVLEGTFVRGGVQGQLRLGASQTIGNYLMPGLMAFCQRQGMPMADMHIANTHSLASMLQNAELDVALVEGVCAEADLEQLPWFEDKMLLITSTKHPLANQYIDFEALNNQSWVLREQASGSRQQFNQRLYPRLSDVAQIHELNSLEAIVSAVAADLGISFISELAIRHQPDIATVTLPETFARPLTMVWRKGKYQSPVFKQFVRLAREYVEPAAE